MLTRSGFGWNATNNTLDAKDDAFENYAKSDPFARSLRYKSFPLYDEWCEVFGKDRATGENAEDIWVITLMLLTMKEVVQRGKRLGDLENRFGTEAESTARKQVWSIVEAETELSIEQKCWVSKKLVNNKADLDLFLSISNDARVAFVTMMADGKI
ncbi:UNVERIFIED_CONTAM: hypothetical protein Slati_0003900 [Sesamum latifolium]|uniref:Myb/SANT-like domain-containing protein n=1 Tax=Sesamum latifolium TaxID=2727402 RepID=A0AAW2Y5T7_9LAMI